MTGAPALDVEGVLFDLDGTLYDTRAVRLRLLARVPGELARHGIVGVARRLRALAAFRRAREAHRGSDPVESLADVLSARVAAQLSYEPALVRSAVREHFLESGFAELRALASAQDRATLLALHARGYALGVLSEYPVDRKLEALGLRDLPWSAAMSCEEVGILKPDPAPFLEAARRMALAPERLLFVGDRRDTDVAGASAAGMRTAWLAARDTRRREGPAPTVTLKSLSELLEHLPRR
jgi:putative hydrolase of the HAD superfamily